jgi:leucyl-tRNA synthetase
VQEDGTCWRGHEGVTSRTIPEWAFRITAYADELLADLDTLSEWPERITSQQRHWIGKSTGARVTFPVVGGDTGIDVFTTRLDTIYGCTYVVLAPEHPLTTQITTAERRADVEGFAARMRQIDTIERIAEGAPKEGVFTGAMALNPYTGEPVPVWVANFVVADYGTGAVMSVPAHDQRDFEFAQEYGLPIPPVVHPADGSDLATPLTAATTDDGILRDSGPFSGQTSAEARESMAEHAREAGFGEAAITWHLRDWGFSRQRYWGTPIPVVYCDTHGTVPVPEDQLPVLLPDFDAVELTGEGGAPLGKLPAFYETTCPECGGPARREIDTMDTFVDSAWYFARYLSPQLDGAPFDRAEAEKWLPVDIYVGGPEHAVMHLLYFRFWTKAMRDIGVVHTDEPATRLITQGMVNAMSFKCPNHGYLPASDLLAQPAGERTCPHCGATLIAAVEKMSKSKYNGIDPMDLIERYGADTARLYTLFAAPPQKDLEWNPDGVEGLARFAARLYRVVQAQEADLAAADLPAGMEGLDGADAAVRQAVHRTLAKVTDEIDVRNHFNTAIAAMMELLNTLYEHKLHEGTTVAPQVARETLLILAQMLSPFAPHLAEEVWRHAGGKGFVAHSRWPTPDPAALVRDTVRMAVQINGKLRGQVDVPSNASEEDIEAAARADDNVARHLQAKTLRKRIVVPGRLINFVV